ncbi:MAG: PP2C family protein-serine/threonine phosphatase [Planctomycetota bacterium]|jgi:DNA-binding NarL/FixJ family response regulator
MNPQPRIRVLLLEDSQSDADLIEIYLQQVTTAEYEVSRSESLGELRELLSARNDFDVVLADLSLPDSYGIETCRRVREAAPTLPIIVLTGLDDESAALEALQSGAQDYLVKGHIDRQLLSRAIRYSIERQKAHELQRQANERMRLISEQLPAVLWTTDTDLCITAPSTACVVHDDFKRPVVGTRLADYFDNPDSDFPPLAAHREALTGKPVSFDFRWKGRSLSVHVEPLHDEAGTIVGTIGISLDVSTQQRMEEELDAARHVQQALFPKQSPQVHGFDLAGAVYPADETAGDYFDYIPMADDCLGLVVGDVTGHGLGPALLMAELRAYLRAIAGTRPHCGEILMLANRFLAADLEEHRFVTLFFARLEPTSRTLTYASAGHGGYLLKASGKTEQLHSTGLPLGLIPDTIINTSFPVELQPGDLFFVPTDGFQEAHTAENELYGLDRMLEFLHRHRDLPAARIIELLRDDVLEFAGVTDRRVKDDMSALLVRCLPE